MGNSIFLCHISYPELYKLPVIISFQVTLSMSKLTLIYTSPVCSVCSGGIVFPCWATRLQVNFTFHFSFHPCPANRPLCLLIHFLNQFQFCCCSWQSWLRIISPPMRISATDFMYPQCWISATSSAPSVVLFKHIHYTAPERFMTKSDLSFTSLLPTRRSFNSSAGYTET